MAKKYFNKLALIILAALVSGCGAWDNFTTYFNVYYNANDNFNDALEEIEKDKKNEKELFQFKQKPVSAASKKIFR